MEVRISKRFCSSRDYSSLLNNLLDEKDLSSFLLTLFIWQEKKLFRLTSKIFKNCVDNNITTSVLNIPYLSKSVNNFWSKLSLLQETSLIIHSHNQGCVFNYQTFRVKKTHTLVFLDLGDTGISDISNLKNCPNLNYLDISSTFVTDLDVIKYLFKLETLIANCLSLSTIEPIKDSKLEKLKLMDTEKLKDISCLQQCSNLKFLNLDGSNSISRFWNSDFCPKFESLNLRDTTLRDLYSLGLCWNLIIKLNLSETEIKNIDCLQGAINLKLLKLEDLNLSNLQPLSFCGHLEKLSLRNSDIFDISPLRTLHKLKNIDIRGCEHLYDLSPLNNCVSLQHVQIDEEYILVFPEILLN